LITNLPAARTGAAGDWRFTSRRTRAAAVFASFVPPHRDLLFGAKDGFFKFEGDIFTQIGAALGTAAPA